MCQFLWQSVLREHCCSQSGGTHCCSQSHSQTVQPEWWEPLVVAVTAAAKVVAASVLWQCFTSIPLPKTYEFSKNELNGAFFYFLKQRNVLICQIFHNFSEHFFSGRVNYVFFRQRKLCFFVQNQIFWHF